ncbi:alpha-taxilin-like isoform X2 [Tigriopus californicus]|nr:alpha-taxilin-like isoform X2 [Tigriopus californicus]
MRSVCLALDESLRQNERMTDETNNLLEQVTKQEQTKETMQRLVEALKTQIVLTKEEAGLKLMEETQKRIDCSQKFQDTMSELSGLVGARGESDSKLREENLLLSQKLAELLAQFEGKEQRMSSFKIEHDLQIKLFEAQLSKAKIEKAELNANFTKERLELHKALLEARKMNEELLEQNREIKEHIEDYQKQYETLQEGLGDKSDHFNNFRKEMERLGKKLRQFERDTSNWKDKFESSNDQVKRMNMTALDREKELEIVKKKLGAMEKLNRALQNERAELKKQLETKS